ncbi:MAG: sugar transferase [Opitutales bacterium]|nr:sugar transferase [Opitutales bacterium]
MKRLLDILVSAFLLLALSLPMLVVFVLVRTQLGKPAFFRQDRPGLGGRIFKLVKFRTMTDERDENGELLPDVQRLRPIGRFLRASSLDELPELWNVLKGDMSLVGPRPLLVSYLPLYNKRQARRHEVRPGITGLAQVSGRNAVSWEERFELDVHYVEHHNLWLDIKILFLTVWTVISRKGINESEGNTMTAFTGSTEKDA